MPPGIGYVERIPRLESGLPGMVPGFREARIAFEIGRLRVDHRDRGASGCQLERAGIEIGQLVGREQREPAPPSEAYPDVLHQVVVRRDADAVADPGARRD